MSGVTSSVAAPAACQADQPPSNRATCSTPRYLRIHQARAALLGPSLVLPVTDCRPVLGTWQQVILVDFDNKPRERVWTVTLMGE